MRLEGGTSGERPRTSPWVRRAAARGAERRDWCPCKVGLGGLPDNQGKMGVVPTIKRGQKVHTGTFSPACASTSPRASAGGSRRRRGRSEGWAVRNPTEDGHYGGNHLATSTSQLERGTRGRRNGPSGGAGQRVTGRQHPSPAAPGDPHPAVRHPPAGCHRGRGRGGCNVRGGRCHVPVAAHHCREETAPGSERAAGPRLCGAAKGRSGSSSWHQRPECRGGGGESATEP